MAYHEDWIGNEYKDKSDVINGIFRFFDNTDEFEDMCECGMKGLALIEKHFTEVFKELPDEMVKAIMDAQDKLFCVDD